MSEIRRGKCIRFFLFAIVLLSVAVFRSFIAVNAAEGRTFRVAPEGDDANPGTSDRPLRTIQKGLDSAQPGDVVMVTAGTFRESLRISKSGSEGKPITLRNVPGTHPVIEVDARPSSDGGRKGILLQAAEGYQFPIKWIVIEGMEIRNGYDGVKMYNAAHITLINNRILDSHNQGILGNGHRVTIDRNLIARNGRSNGNPNSNLQHGIYMTGTYISITNNVFHNNQAYGIQVAGYTGGPESFAGKEFQGAEHWLISNNTFAFHKVRGAIVLWQDATRKCIVQNNIFFKNAEPDITDYTAADADHIIRNNFAGNPHFVDPDKFDFRLRPDSPVAGQGIAELAPKHDFLGNLRRPDRISIGAFEPSSTT